MEDGWEVVLPSLMLRPSPEAAGTSPWLQSQALFRRDPGPPLRANRGPDDDADLRARLPSLPRGRRGEQPLPHLDGPGGLPREGYMVDTYL